MNGSFSGSGGSGWAKMVVAMMQAAAGIGMPTKNRLSWRVACMLNRASLMAPQITKRNETVQPRRPNVESDQEKASTAGATPNETTSAIESNCALAQRSRAVQRIRCCRWSA